MAIKIAKPTEADAERFEFESQGFSEQAAVVAEEQKVARAVAYEEVQARIEEATKVVAIAERARVIADDIRWSDIKKIRQGDMFIVQPDDTASNRRVVLDYLFKDVEVMNRPHFDEWSGRTVDHKGAIIDKNYDATEYLDAYNEAGLRKMEFSTVTEAVRLCALRHKTNSLISRLESEIAARPAWDGIERAADSIRSIFSCFNTELNQKVAHFFWLSVLARALYPGSEASISIGLVGAMGSGKSHFSKQITQLVLGNPKADSAQWNLDGSFHDFLRDEAIGKSFVWNIGEMSGASKADKGKLKNNLTRTVDRFSHKFCDAVEVPRQSVVVFDSNTDVGTQLWPEGNRRTYTFYVGEQEPDERGQRFKDGFVCDRDYLKDNFWNLMLEAKAFFDRHGMEGYLKLQNELSALVFEHNKTEMKKGVGLSYDPDLDFGSEAICIAAANGRQIGAGQRGEGKRIWIKWTDLMNAYKAASGNRNANAKRFKQFVETKGGDWKLNLGYDGFVFDQYPTVDAMVKAFSPEFAEQAAPLSAGQVAVIAAGFNEPDAGPRLH